MKNSNLINNQVNNLKTNVTKSENKSFTEPKIKNNSFSTGSKETKATVKKEPVANVIKTKANITTNKVLPKNNVKTDSVNIRNNNLKKKNEEIAKRNAILSEKKKKETIKEVVFSKEPKKTKKTEPFKANIQRTSSIQSNATAKTMIVPKAVKHKIGKPTVTKKGVLTNAKNKVQNTLNAENDTGTQTVSAVIDTTIYGKKTFTVAQKASPTAVKTVTKTGKGIYKTGEKTIKVARKVGEVNLKLKAGVIVLNKETMNNLKSEAIKRVVYSKPARRIASAVNTVKTTADNTIRYGIKIKNGTIKTVGVATGVLTGATKIKITKDTLNSFKNASWKGIKFTGKTIGYGVKTGTIKSLKTGFWTGKKGIKMFGASTLGVGSFLEQTDNVGTQALSLGIKSGHYTIKGIKTSPKVVKMGARGVKTAVKGTVKTGKGVYYTGKGTINIIKRFRKFGIKDTVKFYNSRMAKAIKKAGSSAVSAIAKAIMSLARKLGMKVLVPLLLIIVLVVGVSGAVSTITNGVSAIFGGIFSIFSTDDTGAEHYEDIETHKFISEKIAPLKNDFIAKIEKLRDDSLVANGGSYHYVRLFRGATTNEIDISADGINSVLGKDEQLTPIIEAVFTTIVLTEYDLTPTEQQANDLVQEIFDTLITYDTKELPVEYCSETSCSSCGKIHADISSCPNIDSGRHSSYTCSSCCYKYCSGHSHTTVGADGKPHTSTSYCSGCEDGCNGYNYCKGHKILGITLNLNGFYDLTNKYFKEEANRLESKVDRTEEEDIKLQMLKDNYELCLDQMAVILDLYGDGAGFGTGEVGKGAEYRASSEVQKKIVDAVKITPASGAGWCAMWVSSVYQNAGLGYLGGNACDMYRNFTFTSDRSKLEVGMLVAVESSSSGSIDGQIYGHVGIYIGDGKVADNIGYVNVSSLDDWIASYCKHSPVGFGFPPSVQN